MMSPRLCLCVFFVVDRPTAQHTRQHYRIAARTKFARRSARHDLTVSIDDLDLQMRMDAADRADAPLDRRIA
jgi:hypothetical protein